MRSTRFIEFSPIEQSLGLSGNSANEDISNQRLQLLKDNRLGCFKRSQRIKKLKQVVEEPQQAKWHSRSKKAKSSRRSSLATLQSQSNKPQNANQSTTPTTFGNSDPSTFRLSSDQLFLTGEDIELIHNDHNPEVELQEPNSNLSNYIDLINQLFMTTAYLSSDCDMTKSCTIDLLYRGINVRNWLGDCFKQPTPLQPTSKQVFSRTEITEQMRELIVVWLYGVNKMFKFQQQTFLNAVYLVDRCLARSPFLPAELQLLAVTALEIAAKFEDKVRFSYHDLAALSDQAFGSAEIISMEARILELLDYDIHCFTAFDLFQVIRLFSEGAHKDVNAFTGFILHLMMVQPRYLDFDIAVLATSAACFAILTTGNTRYLSVLQDALKCFNSGCFKLNEYAACFQYIDYLIRAPVGQQLLQKFLQA